MKGPLKMTDLKQIFAYNRKWAAQQQEGDPDFFARLSTLQAPKYLWIGCSDSRVPANQIMGLAPGEVFVHRNVANLVGDTDMNCLSVMQFAVEVLKVEHIIVCGHYGCGGVRAACGHAQLGLIDNWLRPIKHIYNQYANALEALPEPERFNHLCELNVKTQVQNVCRTTIVQNAWARGQNLTVHGLVYGLNDGLLRDLGVNVESAQQLDEIYRMDPA